MSTKTNTVPARSVRRMTLIEMARLGRNFGVSPSEILEAFRQPPVGPRGKFFPRKHRAAQLILAARRSEANRQGWVSRKLKGQ